MPRCFSGRRPWGFACALLLVLIISGCASAPALALGDLPVPPGLEKYEGAAETPLDGMWSAMTLARASVPRAPAVEYYWMPQGTSWEAVDAFYGQQLGPDWRRDPEHTLPTGGRWIRSSAAGQQVLVVSEIGVNDAQGSILMLSLITE